MTLTSELSPRYIVLASRVVNSARSAPRRKTKRNKERERERERERGREKKEKYNQQSRMGDWRVTENEKLSENEREIG